MPTRWKVAFKLSVERRPSIRLSLSLSVRPPRASVIFLETLKTSRKQGAGQE